MAIQIIDSDQPLKVESIIVVIFGIPGIGKTSLAFTANVPFLLDFDGGLQRSVKRKKAARVDSWEDAVEFYMSGQLEELQIKAIVIDTVGTMLDNYISASAIKNDAKNAKKDGALSLSGYGAMKNIFNQFVNQMRLKKIDLIFIAHDVDAEEGGYMKKKPKVTGGSYDILKGAADLIGYLYMENNKRILDFNPTDSHEGKNSAEFDKMFVPHYTAGNYDGFMDELIQRCKGKMNHLSEEMVEAQNLVEEFKGFIGNCDTIEELTMLEDNINESLSQTYRVQVQHVYDQQFTLLFSNDVDKVTAPKQMDVILKIASEQPKKYTQQIKGTIASKMEELGFIYDKEAKKIIVAHVDKDNASKQPDLNPKPNEQLKLEETKPKKNTDKKANN